MPEAFCGRGCRYDGCLEFVKDQYKQKASVVVLTFLFELEGISEEMGHLHHGDQDIYGPV